MFGTYRLILACLVALSHFGLILAGFNPGQWAVLSFYVLSGFLMEHQFHKLSPAGEFRFFYIDRFLRIYPLFLVVLIFAACLVHPTWEVFALNLLLIPLNYSSFTGLPLLISPTWSLACEAQFYLLVPFFSRSSTRVVRGILLCSVALFCVSPFLPGSTFWAYTGLPGILFSFLSGTLIKRGDLAFLLRIWMLFAGLLAAFLISKFTHSGLPTGIHINMCIGYLTALPLVTWLSSLGRDRHSRPGLEGKSIFGRWDERLGLLSYPLFLVHHPVRDFAALYFNNLSAIPALALAIGASALLVFIVEKPFDYIRYGIRKRWAVARSG